jgi:hypothetical protein
VLDVCAMDKCGMATLPQPTLIRSARAQPGATSKLLVVTQHPTVGRGCEVVAQARPERDGYVTWG